MCGWSPGLFQKRIADGFDILTYRKGNARKRLRWEFHEHRAVLDGREVEALARAAEAAADGLPAATTDRQRLTFGRIQSLATKTSQQASASLRFADLQVAALAAYMDAHRRQLDRIAWPEIHP